LDELISRHKITDNSPDYAGTGEMSIGKTLATLKIGMDADHQDL
jgi:hypothetical protein